MMLASRSLVRPDEVKTRAISCRGGVMVMLALCLRSWCATLFCTLVYDMVHWPLRRMLGAKHAEPHVDSPQQCRVVLMPCGTCRTFCQEARVASRVQFGLLVHASAAMQAPAILLRFDMQA